MSTRHLGPTIFSWTNIQFHCRLRTLIGRLSDCPTVATHQRLGFRCEHHNRCEQLAILDFAYTCASPADPLICTPLFRGLPDSMQLPCSSYKSMAMSYTCFIKKDKHGQAVFWECSFFLPTSFSLGAPPTPPPPRALGHASVESPSAGKAGRWGRGFQVPHSWR